jgi:hypothetical protein
MSKRQNPLKAVNHKAQGDIGTYVSALGVVTPFNTVLVKGYL